MRHRIVLGLGNSVDHEVVWDLGVLGRMVDDLAVGLDDLDPDVAIRSERDLLRVLLAFMSLGTGGERFVEDDQVVWDFSRRFATVPAVGGTPVRAAIALDKIGLASTVHLVSTDDFTRSRLPASCRVIGGVESTRVHPHVIVQFGAGDQLRVGEAEIRAPFSNRVIFAHDPPNRELRLSTELPDALQAADVVLLSGLNSVQDAAVAAERAGELVTMITDRVPAGALVYYEDAGFHNRSLGARVAAALAGVVSVHGMNEDEMQAYLGRPVDLVDPRSVASALEALRRRLRAPTIVVHTRFWAAAVGRDATSFRTALAGGTAMATARCLRGDGFSAEDHESFRTRPPTRAARDLAASIEDLLTDDACVVPTHLLTRPDATTIGLGDTFVAGFLAAHVTACVDATGGTAHPGDRHRRPPTDPKERTPPA